jgi:hypothetical protein
MADDRQFWLEMRRGLLMQLEAIEKWHLPDKHAETLEAREWLQAKREERIAERQRATMAPT